MNNRIDGLGYAQRQRLTFLESVAYWEGAVHRPRVAGTFNVTPNHVSKDFSLYQREYPDSIRYDEKTCVYRPLPKFKPKIARGTAEEYLSHLQTLAQSEQAGVVPTLRTAIVTTAVPHPMGKLDATVLHMITRAISARSGLDVSYQSLGSGQPKARKIWPHALVFTGLRWHARAFDDLTASFLDLVLHRFVSAKPLKAESPSGVEVDRQWHKIVTIDVRPRRTFTPSQAQVIAHEYGMTMEGKQWVWKVRLRECLAHYFLTLYRLDLLDDPDRLIELRDKKDRDRYLLPAGRTKLASSDNGKA